MLKRSFAVIVLMLVSAVVAEAQEVKGKFEDCLCLGFKKQEAVGGVVAQDFFDTFTIFGEASKMSTRNIFHNREYDIWLSFESDNELATIAIKGIPVVHMDLESYMRRDNKLADEMPSLKIKDVYAITDLEMVREVLHRVRDQKGIMQLAKGLDIVISDLPPALDREQFMKQRFNELNGCYDKYCK